MCWSLVYTFSVHMTVACTIVQTRCLDPQWSEFLYTYGWLNKICGCFSAKLEYCGEGIFPLKILAV